MQSTVPADVPEACPTAYPGRNVPVDAAKSLAIFGVMLIHSFAVGGYAGTIGTPVWDGALFWGTVLRCAVPVFFLCSGALLLGPERKLTIRRVWSRNILRIFIALLFWASVYEGVSLLLTWRQTGVLEWSALRQAAVNVILFHHKPHLYYLHIMLLVYVLLPLTRVFTAHADRRELEYALGAWLILGIVLPILRPLRPLSLLTGIPTQYPLNLTYSSLGYTVAGFYLTRYAREHRPRFYVLLFLAGLAVTYCGTLALSIRNGELYQGLLSGSAPGVCAQALGLYGFCASRFSGWERCRWAETLSKASFCIFLTHMLALDTLQRLNLTAARFCPAISVPVVALVLLTFGYALWLVLRNIPVVNRWLI